MGVEYDYISKGQAEYELEIKINEEMDTWEYFDRRLFQLYRDSGMSMRKIASETRISTKTIFYSIKKSKERLREKCAEDYEDYINEDYELI
jgi:DNA-directed RNA polymerase specialized sigma subunit